MQECMLFILLAVAVACCTSAARVEADQLLTTFKCCKAAGDLSFSAKGYLPPSEAKFWNQICTQGSGIRSKCQKKTYTFSDFKVQFSSVQTLFRESDCTSQNASRCHDQNTWESSVKKSELDRAKNLRCPMDSILRKSNAITCDKRPTVAIFADYDNCWDIISATNPIAKGSVFNANSFRKPYKDVIRSLSNKLEDITRMARVILFVGSNRQSLADDIYNNVKKQNGLALGANGAFERWVQEFWGVFGHCWELNKALLSDYDKPCSSWNNYRSSPTEGLSQQETKTKLLQNGIKQLLLENHVELYLFDAYAEFLTHVRSSARIPPNMQLHTVHYNWVDFATGTTTTALKEIS